MTKVEIHCPACGRGYLLDRAALGALLVCPACSKPMELAAAGSAALGNAVDRALGARAPAEPTPSPVTISKAAGIVCPRCNLHFTPDSGRQVQARAPGKRPTVLIVEDMPYFMQIASDALSPTCEIVTTASVVEAETILSGGGIDLMVLDLTLEGAEQGRRLLRGPEHKSCPVLIYTAKDESEMYGEPWDELSRMGADDVVIKGMQVGESLRRKVGELLGIEMDAEEAIG